MERLAWPGLRKLAQKAGVVLDEEADVLDAVLNHGKSVETHAEGVAGELGRVEGVVASTFVDGREDSGVDHATAGDLDPLGLFAFDLEFDVDFKAWLGEGKEVRAEANFRFIAEHGAVEVFESTFEVGEANIGIDVETFKLIEDGEVGGVDFVAPIGGSGCNDFDGWTLLFHGANLHAGGVGAEEFA